MEEIQLAIRIAEGRTMEEVEDMKSHIETTLDGVTHEVFIAKLKDGRNLSFETVGGVVDSNSVVVK